MTKFLKENVIVINSKDFFKMPKILISFLAIYFEFIKDDVKDLIILVKKRKYLNFEIEKILED